MSWLLLALKTLLALLGLGKAVRDDWHDSTEQQVGRDDVSNKTKTVVAEIADKQSANNLAPRDLDAIAERLQRELDGGH